MAAALCIGLLSTSVSQAATIALKNTGDSALDQTTDSGGAIHADFLALSASDIVNVDVDDTGFHDNNANNVNYGANASLSSSYDDKLFKFDVASLTGFAGSTVARAELRLWQTGGNNKIEIARNLIHDVDETTAVRNDPAGTGTDSWGPASDAEFGPNDYGALAAFDSPPAGARFQVVDVTADLQGFADGSLTNLGWAVISVNRSIAMSEFDIDGQRPVLFLDFEPATVPEPTSMVMLGTATMCLALLRRRK